MARKKRRRLKFDEESVNGLLQEIYEDTYNIRAKIVRLYNKWEVKVKEGGEIAALGDSIVKLIAAEAKNQDQKIVLLRYLKEVVYENKRLENVNTNPKKEEEISSEKRNDLINMVQNELKKVKTIK